MSEKEKPIREEFFPIEEIVAAAASLGEMPSVVAAALKLGGKTEYSREEALKAIKNFKKSNKAGA